ncbi:unnamed protein product [Calicophoron daubneyi]|uniref:Protein FAM76A n=1 Tax=Calicophoron daubneyi TaxID=300641 RepID=A0AAV2TUC2_CALDB
MDQPMFECTKCFRNFPQSEMSRSGQMCKGCNPHHSTFKQCEYCRSDFKYYVYGTICPRCQSLKSKFGEPQPCSICKLKTAFGNALVCQRCLHYRNRFGEPRECQNCGQNCAFLKDEASRQKVDGQILCWVCTYNFKLARSRERSDRGTNKRHLDAPSGTDSSLAKNDRNEQLKRTRSEDYNTHKSESHLFGSQQPPSTQNQSLDSVYNEHLLTIGQLQDEVKCLKRQLAQKDADMLAKDRTIAELRSEIIEIKETSEDRLLKYKASAQMEQERLTATIKQLQKEKVTLCHGLKKRKSTANFSSSLRYSSSSTTLFSPDSPILVSSVHEKLSKTNERHSTPQPTKPSAADDGRSTSVEPAVKTDRGSARLRSEDEQSSAEDHGSPAKIKQIEDESPTPPHSTEAKVEKKTRTTSSPELSLSPSSSVDTPETYNDTFGKSNSRTVLGKSSSDESDSD